MLVTFTNITSGVTAQQVYISNLYISLDPGKSVQVQRSGSDIEQDVGIRQMIAAGQISLSFSPEASDSFPGGASFQASPPNYTDLTRPDPTTVPKYSFIWNTGDNAYNFSDGVIWRDAMGAAT